MVESRSPKPLVVGSSPTAPAKTHSDSSGCVFLFPGKLRSGLTDHHPLTDNRKQISGALLKDSSWTAQAISATTGLCPGCRCAACPADLVFDQVGQGSHASAQCGSFASTSNAVCLCASRQPEPAHWCRICCIFGGGLGTGLHPVKSGKLLHQKHLTFIRGHDIVNAYKYNKRSL